VSDDICAKLERLARYAPAWSDVLLAAAAELRQTRKERDEARDECGALRVRLRNAHVDVMASDTGTLRAVKSAEQAQADLAAAVELLNVWLEPHGRIQQVHDDTRAFLEAVEKREGER
jgi:hypothetical protein